MADRWADLQDVDRVVHEPARLVILGILSVAGKADFAFLMNETGLTKGNLSSHLAKLEQATYLAIEKTYKGKVPLTLVKITPAGRTALQSYRRTMTQVLALHPKLA